MNSISIKLFKKKDGGEIYSKLNIFNRKKMEMTVI